MEVWVVELVDSQGVFPGSGHLQLFHEVEDATEDAGKAYAHFQRLGEVKGLDLGPWRSVEQPSMHPKKGGVLFMPQGMHMAVRLQEVR